MNEPHDPNRTIDVPSVPADSLDAGLAAGFGPPRSSLPDMRPVLLKEAEGDSAHVVKPQSDAMPPPEQTGDRYQLEGEIARGGMGAVLRGRDVDLGRDLAVKVLLEKHAHRPEVARRFLEEAQVGAQLQHPGVVPVYDIGRFGDRPFFTMKLVKGHTLAALLAERADHTQDRPRFLAIALQVCQALAYAHAKGVIHRDLKPANIMVGAFGEVQVMDWGLAKVLAEGGVADEERASRQHQPEEGTLIRTARSSSAGSFGTQTEAGSLLGTPAYMPPEQANGDVANLDRRADVFGLGAILCEVLTGKPPHVGRSSEEVRRKAANGDLADAMARLDSCGADAELIALTKACLAPEAMDRPKDAQAVAEALTAYLDGVQDRLRKAELAEAEAKAKAVEEAKRRRLTLALAATVLLAVTVGGGGWLWVKADRDARLAQTARDVNEALNQAMALREKAKSPTTGGAAAFAQAREQVQRALALVESGPADAALKDQVERLKGEVDEEEKDRQVVAALEEARLAQTDARTGNGFAQDRAVPLFREAFRAYGLPAGQGESRTAAERIRQRPPAVQAAIVAALDEWDGLAGIPELRITEPHREWLRAVLKDVEPEDVWGRQLRAALAEGDPVKRNAALEVLASSADVRKMPAHGLTRLAARLSPPRAIELLRRAQGHYPADFWVNHDLGMALLNADPLRPGVFFRPVGRSQPGDTEAVRFLSAAMALRPASPGCRVNLAMAQIYKGQFDEAIVNCRKAIELAPTLVTAHFNLGLALDLNGQLDEAIASYKKGIELDPKFAEGYSNLGLTLAQNGQVDAAIANLRKALDLTPAHNGVSRQLAMGHSNLGSVLCDHKRDYPAAIACFQKGIGLDPNNARLRVNLGNALRKNNQLDEAIASYREAAALDPTAADAHIRLGAAQKARGRLGAAIASHRKAIELDPKNVTAHLGLAEALKETGQVAEAVVVCKKAVELDPKRADAHDSLGVMLTSKGDHDAAIACFRKAIDLDPKRAVAHYNLGNAERATGQRDAAIACYRKAIKLEPQHDAFHVNLGAALHEKGQLEEAIGSYRKARELDPKNGSTYYNLGLVLMESGRLEEAIPSYQKAIELDPKVPHRHGALIQALLMHGRYVEAKKASNRALALLPEGHPMRATFSEQIQTCERFLKLEARLPRILRGEDKASSAQEYLDLATMCITKRLHAGVARCSAEAFAADPKRADDLRAGHRYHAACAAALAANGEGEDTAGLDAAARKKLRGQALDWLKADLAAWGKVTESSPPQGAFAVVRTLSHWQKDAKLASIRAGAALDRLPAEERAACEKLWADAAALLKKAEALDVQAGKEAGPVHEVGQGLELRGRLDERTSALLYQVKLAAGKTYVIDMISPDQKALDPYLVLTDALGKKLAEDDDSGGGLNARITFRPAQGGAFRVHATSFNAGRGAFTLTVREQQQVKVEGKGNEEAAKLKLATEYLQAGKRDLALPLLAEIWEGRKARLGRDHPDTLDSMNQLGVVYWQTGRLDKSVPVFEELLKIREAKLGRGHPETLHSVANLGVNYKDAGRLKEAIALLEEAHRAAQKEPKLAWVLPPLIDAYTRAGANSKLAEVLVAELPAARKLLPPGSPQLAGLLAQGGMALLKLKRWAEAEPLLRECLAIREEKQPDVWATFNTRSMLGGALLGQKKYADAEPLLLAGYQGMRKREGTIPPPGRPRLVEAVERLVQLYEALGRRDEVARWSKELEAIKAAQKKAEEKP